jgi:DNA modification methylase
MPSIQLLTGDCRDLLAGLASGSVSCCITSPPYWGLRDYGLPPSTWGGDPACAHVFEVELPHGRRGKRGISGTGGTMNPALDRSGQGPGAGGGGQFCDRCGCWRGCLGLEPTVDLFVAHLVEVFQAVRRVLRPDGTLWLNLGDSYFGDSPCRTRSSEAFSETWDPAQTRSRGGNRRSAARQGALKPKDLCGVPWRVALALQADGWWLRSDIVWAKPNVMPSPVRDRPTPAHEFVFLLTQSPRYYYNADAIREPTGNEMSWEEYAAKTAPGQAWKSGGRTRYAGAHKKDGGKSHPLGRNKRTVWSIPTRSVGGGVHFATFPPALVEPMILAGCPPSGTVLDCFGGSGTVGVVAAQLGRSAILMDANPAYTAMASGRIADGREDIHAH